MQKVSIWVAMVMLGIMSVGCKKTKHQADLDACLANCRLRATELHCDRPEGCRDACTKLLESKVCARELRAFMDCFLKEPSQHWICADGLPTVQEQFCEREQGTIVNCLEKANAHP
jgi:hypothetical protein